MICLNQRIVYYATREKKVYLANAKYEAERSEGLNP